jgi:hypothetical protein
MTIPLDASGLNFRAGPGAGQARAGPVGRVGPGSKCSGIETVLKAFAKEWESQGDGVGGGACWKTPGGGGGA